MSDSHVYNCTCVDCVDDRKKLRAIKGRGKYTKPYKEDSERPKIERRNVRFIFVP